MFKRVIIGFGHNLVEMHPKVRGELRTEPFLDLPGKSRGLNIIFGLSEVVSVEDSDELTKDIYLMASLFLMKLYKMKPQFHNISEMCGVLWQDSTRESNKRRKLAKDLGVKQLRSYGKQVYEYYENNSYGND